MKEIFRFFRIIVFVLGSMVVCCVYGYNIPFLTIFDHAFHANTVSDYFCTVIMVSFILYPVLFILTIVCMKAEGWHVYWIHGPGELSLLQLFVQNELRPFWKYLTDTRTYNAPKRFPYSVDMGFRYHNLPYPLSTVLAFLYRVLHTIIASCLLLGIYGFVVMMLAKGLL